MPSDKDRRWLLQHGSARQHHLVKELAHPQRRQLLRHWPFWARPEQLPPPGDWRLWLICAGRGFGKTRAGAEWVGMVARTNPQARIALIGSSIGEARSVMVEGESGILACSGDQARPLFEASLRKLTWPNGAQAFLYSAGEPESLRGPQHSHACRTGAEGGVRKRGSRPRRYAASSRNSRHCKHAASRAARW
jgi:phage terminase large subunit-like protein